MKIARPALGLGAGLLLVPGFCPAQSAKADLIARRELWLAGLKIAFPQSEKYTLVSGSNRGQSVSRVIRRQRQIVGARTELAWHLGWERSP